MNIRKEDLFTIPNILTYFRIMLVPVFLYTYFKMDTGHIHIYSTIILVISGITDFLDGYIARAYHMITDLGRTIDPIADKLTQFVVAIALVSTYPSYMWVIAVMLVKDSMLLFFHYYIYKKSGQHITQANMPGKIATAAFYVVSIILIVFYIPHTMIANVLIYCTTILLFLALVNYSSMLFTMYNNISKE